MKIDPGKDIRVLVVWNSALSSILSSIIVNFVWTSIEDSIWSSALSSVRDFVVYSSRNFLKGGK